MRVLGFALALAAYATSARAAEPPPDPVQLSGYVQVAAFAGADGGDPAGRLDFVVRKVRVRLRAQWAEQAGLVAMVDAADTPLVKDAYLWWAPLPWLELRAGQQKTQFGFENVEAASRLYVIHRSQVSERLGRGKDRRDLGVGLVLRRPAVGSAGFDGGLTLVNGAGEGALADDTPEKSLFARGGGWWRIGAGTLSGGLSFGSGSHLDGGVRRAFTRFGADARADLSFALLVAEAITGVERWDALEGRSLGAYALAVGKTRWSAGPLARFAWLDLDLSRPGPLHRALAVGAYWDPLPDVRLTVIYERAFALPAGSQELAIQLQGAFGERR